MADMPEVEFTAWEQADGEPGKEHRFMFRLAGMRGTVQFMYLSYDFQGELREMGSDLGYHSPRPLYDGQRQMSLPGECDAFRGAHKNEPCYYDGSGLSADRLYKKWVAAGKDKAVIWEALRDWYFDVFYDGEWEAGHKGEPYQTSEERDESMLENLKMIRDSNTIPIAPELETLIASYEERLGK